MNTDINKMFLNKNKEIFKNSLELEMERNLEALKNTTDNCVALEVNKLYIFFKKYFQEIDLEYKKEELLGILYRERKNLNDIVNIKIEEKKQNIKKNYLGKEDTEEELTQEYIDNYYNELVKETNRIKEDIDLEIKKEICTNFSPKIQKKYKLDSIEQVERINSRINVLFKDNVIKRMIEEIEFRDESLKNMSIESYKKYVDLNKRTVE